MANDNTGIVILLGGVAVGALAYYFTHHQPSVSTTTNPNNAPFQVGDCVSISTDVTHGYTVESIGYDSSKFYPWYFMLSNGSTYYSNQLTKTAPGLCVGQVVTPPPQQTKPAFTRGDCVQYAAIVTGGPPQPVFETVLDEAWNGYTWEYSLSDGTVQPESNLAGC